MAVTKKKPSDVDFDILTDADKDRLRKKAEQQILSERKKVAEDAQLSLFVQEERAKFSVDEEMVEVLIDLPAFCTSLLIDGVAYHHGEVVPVSRGVAASIREQMSNCWLHEKSTGNPNIRNYKPVKEDSFSASSAGYARV